MRTKFMLASLAGLAVLAIASAASAGITVTQSPYYTFGTDQSVFTGQVICNFESACASGYSSSFSGGGAITTGSVDGVTAAPPGDGTHYATLPGSNGSWTLNSDHVLNDISFFMGSPDTYNSITFFNGATQLGSFTGSDFVGGVANGDQSLGERIYFSFNGAQVNRIVLSSTSNAFEFDNVGIGGVGGVPEPATWAMMIVGMGMVGAGLRMRRQDRRALTAAA